MIQPPLPLSSGIHWNMNIPKFYINQRIQYVVFFVCILLLSIVILKLTKFKKRILFIFQEVGREKERERNINVWEKHQSVASHTPPFGDLARNPAVCPDQESKWRPFGSQACAQSTEPHQPGPDLCFPMCIIVHHFLLVSGTSLHGYATVYPFACWGTFG